MRGFSVAVVITALLFIPATSFALTEAEKCASYKLTMAGNYAACLLKADAKSIKKGVPADYSKCERLLTLKYTRAEFNWACETENEVGNVSALLQTCAEGVQTATETDPPTVVSVSPGWVCTGHAPDNCEAVCGDSLTVGSEFCDDGNTTGSDGCSADCLSGCGDGIFEPAEGEECDDGNGATDDGCTAQCALESCGDTVQQASEACDDGNNTDGDGCSADCQSDEACGNGVVDAVTGEQCDDGNLVDGDGCSSLCEDEGPSCSDDPQPVWVEHGDGTVTQCSTGLMWEMKTGTAESSVNCDSALTCPDPHDVRNKYTWSASYGATNEFDGTAATVFLAQLNTPPCFAGHCDWRLPTSAGNALAPTGQAAELESLLIEPYPCGTSPCTTIPGETYYSFYYSSSPLVDNPLGAAVVFFTNGTIGWTNLDAVAFVRAVRDPS